MIYITFKMMKGLCGLEFPYQTTKNKSISETQYVQISSPEMHQKSILENLFKHALSNDLSDSLTDSYFKKNYCHKHLFTKKWENALSDTMQKKGRMFYVWCGVWWAYSRNIKYSKFTIEALSNKRLGEIKKFSKTGFKLKMRKNNSNYYYWVCNAPDWIKR